MENGNIFEVLNNLSVKGNNVEITEELARKTYLSLKKVLDSIGGRWDKKLKKYVFSYDVKPVIDEIIQEKELPKKNPTAFFPTQPREIKLMFNYADMLFKGELITCDCENLKILEPSAGQGAIAKEIKKAFPNAQLDTVEFLEMNQKILKSEGFSPYCQDFLDFNRNYEVKYDYIFMNPPFSYQGHKYAYIEHVNHAFNMLSAHGVLIAIAPSSYLKNNTKLEKKFYNLVSSCLNVEIIEGGAFSSVGTNVETSIFALNKRKDVPCNGYMHFISYSFFLSILNDFQKNTLLNELFINMQRNKEYNNYKVEELLQKFLENFKNNGVFFPFDKMDEYLVDAKRLFDMDYEIPIGTEVKKRKIKRPTLFEIAA